MGVPKFARFICERYPCIIELLNEYQIPEFDNLYLDMNGIIHCCSHPNDADAHFRITEEAIFKNIFHYIEILFRTINPQKLFFMAVDGVAPRAKINQQRGRRFRTAKEAEVVEARARARGETISTQARFDSNCITPGTVFMAKLTEQLKYFVTYKITTDKLWQKCKIILSGPEVPGEGEHKIMDYIRYIKSQPDHDPNTRHCLYGLDADLIMLGLCTHEPHFAVLREEVKYGRNVQKTISPEKTKFCLLHLSLLREYLDHEFESLKSTLPFAYDLEKIIDDWILMGFLIGNDFIPHLPHIHIINGSFPVLYRAYMEVLPTLDGYINEAGYLNLPRFEKFMERLAAVDVDRFADHQAELKYFEAKTGRLPNEHERTVYRKNKDSPVVLKPNSSSKKQLNALIQQTAEILQGHSDEDACDSDSESDLNSVEFVQHKRDYYMTKFDYTEVDATVLRSQAEGYVTAIQWILHYYYNGCQSWSWFYPHHYAPYISDIKDFKDFKLNFDMGKPFLPFEQLLAVLPAASKSLLPEAYQGLLTEEESPIIGYYPLDFQTDMNEKKQEWEAVVLIPFINEDKLIAAMKPLNHKLTAEEQKRNSHGPMHVIKYSEESLGVVRAPEYFPAIESHAEIVTMDPEAIVVPADELVKGLCPGAKLNVFYHGFPTLQHIEHTAKLEKSKVKVFEQASQNDNMILTIVEKKLPTLNQLAAELLGKLVFVKWPHLLEALVVAVSNGERKFSLVDTKASYSLDNLRREELKNASGEQWRIQAQSLAGVYRNRYGIDVGETKLLIHARPISGRRYILTTQGRLSLQQEWSTHAAMYAYQTILRDSEVERDGYVAHKDVNDVFRQSSVCFMLGHPHYGAIGEVTESGMNPKTGRVRVAMRYTPEPKFGYLKREQDEAYLQYMYGSVAGNRLGISAHLLSRITGCIYVQTSRNEQERKPNIGLNLKFNKRNEELPGYTKKFDNQWTYSMKSVELIRAYMNKFPVLFEYLAYNVGNDIIEQDQFPSNVEDLSSVLAWLNEQPFRNVTLRSCNCRGLEPEIIEKLMEVGSKYAEEELAMSKTVFMQVKPHLLYKPELSAGNIAPDPSAVHRVFDRVIVVKEGFCVPLGYKGTIVAVQNDDPDNISYDILFDKAFIGSVSVTGTGTMRRYKLFTAEFINISHGYRAEEDITGLGVMLNKLIQKKQDNESSPKPQKPSAFASYNKHGNFFPEFGKERQNKAQAQEPQIRVMKKDPEAKVNPKVNPKANLNSPMKKHVGKKNESPRQQPKKPAQEKKVMPQAAAAPAAPATPAAAAPVVSQAQANSTPNTEFQMLWNELHKSTSTTPKPMASPMTFPMAAPMTTPMPTPMTAPMPAPIPPVIHPTISAPQDPSAFLKAVLKISDDSSTSNSYHPPPAESFGYVPRPVPPPPLNVAGWMDQLKQYKPPVAAPPVKDGCYYSTLLLNHMQRVGAGVPRYYYSPHNNLIRSSIVLPDLRVFQGDLCANHHLARENVSAKVCQELKIEVEPCKPQNIFKMMPPDAWISSVHPQPPMNMQNMMSPRPFLDSQMPSMRPPVPANPLMPQSAPGFTQIASVRPPHMMPPRPLGAERKDLKQSTPFVPLQAQKKTRGRKMEPVQALKNPEVAAKTQQSPKIQKANKQAESSSAQLDNVRKGAKSIHCNDLIIATCEGSKEQAPVQKAPKAPKQRKSRIAANFGSASMANGADAQQ